MRSTKIQLPIIALIVITLGCLIGISLWFDSNTGKIIENSVKKSLEQTCRAQALGFKTRLDDHLSTLNSMTLFFEETDMLDKESRRKTIYSFRTLRVFSDIYVADSKGNSISALGNEINVSRIPFFAASINNRSAISKTILTEISYDEQIVISVPIKQDHVVKGVLFALLRDRELNTFMNGFNYSSNMTSILVSAEGMIIARPDNSSLITNRIINFFDLATSWGLNGKTDVQTVKDTFNLNKFFMIPYESGSLERLAILAPVAIEDWYFVLITPQTILSDMSTTISSQILSIEASITLAFILLIVSILFLIRSNNKILRTNEKFRLATQQTQTVVFDYDFYKEKLEFSGNTEFLNLKFVDCLEGKEVKEFLDQIHEDDLSFRTDLKNLKSNKENSFNKEVRIKCSDNNYYWFKVIGTVVRADNGAPHHFVGNIVNVDEIMNKEKMLKQKAEEDPLTGILNKGAFREKIENLLSKDFTNETYAFYIIDLDNFKKVNDSMGHTAGDKVLIDTAKKLCTIFSDKDFVGRIGGDEFAAFLKLQSVDSVTAEKLLLSKAKAICDQLNEVYSDNNVKINVSSSIGLAIYPQHGIKYADLYRHADEALYTAKFNGKNQFHIYSK